MNKSAITDLYDVLRSDPNDTNAYSLRGTIYGLLNNDRLACIDFRKGCELGDCAAYNVAKQNRICR